MILRLLCALLLAAPLQAGPPTDPFAPGPSWTDAVVAAKPFLLEVCAGEVDASAAPLDSTDRITPEFLAAAKRLRIRVAAADEGSADLPYQLKVVYRLKPQGADHGLEIQATFRDPEAGVREVNSRLVLAPGSGWVVLGGLTREHVKVAQGVTTSTIRNLIFAFRLVPSAEES